MSVWMFIPIMINNGKWEINDPWLIGILVFLSLLILSVTCFCVYVQIQVAKKEQGLELEKMLKKKRNLEKEIMVIEEELNKIN